MDSGLTASDVALLNGRNDGFGDNSFMWIFALLVLANGGFGNWGNNRCGDNPVTEADLCNANSFNELKGAVGRLNDANANYFMRLQDVVQNGLCNMGYTNLQNFNTTQRVVLDGFTNLERVLSDCCCRIERMIDNVNFNMSQATASINATTTAVMQKILDKMCEDKAERQAARINQLELQQALCGVVRYPLGTMYDAGRSPFFGNNCCNNGCNNGYYNNI